LGEALRDVDAWTAAIGAADAVLDQMAAERHRASTAASCEPLMTLKVLIFPYSLACRSVIISLNRYPLSFGLYVAVELVMGAQRPADSDTIATPASL
jgi:hypothetical protein